LHESTSVLRNTYMASLVYNSIVKLIHVCSCVCPVIFRHIYKGDVCDEIMMYSDHP
jgi:hypothetical protein